MKNILSIQSHVASGYVGNRSAVFPLQRLGHEVNFINTVQFSNHTGYGQWTGEIFSAQHIRDVLSGLKNNGRLETLDAVLSGYQGKPELGQVIIDTVQQIKQQKPDLLYCCDPVLGDVDRDVYVLPETAQFIKQQAIAAADLITPNQFELGYLTDTHIKNFNDINTACAQLHQQGPKIILITSLCLDETAPDTIEMLVSTKTGKWITNTPKFKFPKSPCGSGDATAAIFLAKYLESKNIVLALEHTTAAMHAIFKTTHDNQSYELSLIAAQDEIKSPKTWFKARKVN